MMRTRAEVLRHLQEHPDQHRHTFRELLRCCMVDIGGGDLAVDISLIEAHAGLIASRHDVTQGPCGCGQVHGQPIHADERRRLLRQYLELLTADGLLLPTDPTCKLFAIVDDDRKALFETPLN